MILRVLVGLGGLALVFYGGQLAIMPVVTLGVLLWVLERTRWQRELFRYCYAAGGAYAFWAVAGVFLQGRSAADWAIEGIVAALPLLWLWAKPESVAAAIVCSVIFLLEFAITAVSVPFARVGSQAHKVLLVHGALKAMVLISLFVGLVRLRRDRRRLHERSAS
jgi:hypothetical protein